MSLAATTRHSSTRESDRKSRAKSLMEGTGGTSEESVKVICRVRPFNPREIEINEQSNVGKDEWDQNPLRSVVEFDGPRCTFLDHEKAWMEKETFQFDSCIWSIPDETQSRPNNPFGGQDALFNQYGTVIMQQTWKGYNTCVFAYGQTGAGKTYSMMGEDPINNVSEAGLIPRVCQRLFETVAARRAEAETHKEKYVMSFKVEARYIEIYEEKIKDLLWPLSTLPPEVKVKTNDENLKLRSSPATGVFIENLTSVEVDSWERMLELIELGNTSRHVAATKMNERSSRSHAIFKIHLAQVTTSIPKKQFEKPVEHVRESLLNLVDLAGSERNKKTGATGERLREAASINRSLLALKQCIEALADNSTMKGSPRKVPYRDSHLTALLMDSLGGNSKTFMLICVSPHIFNAEETLQTLRYGSRARQIVNVVKVNENSAGRMLLDLEDELAKMKGEMEKQSNPEAIEDLKAQIADRENSLQLMETEMDQQRHKIAKLHDEQQREKMQREAVALQKLVAISQATKKHKEVSLESQRLRKKLSDVQYSKTTLEKRYETAEHDEDRLQDLIEDYKLRAAELEQEIFQEKRRYARLETYIKEISKTIEDEQLELERLKNEKLFSTILRARLHGARIRLAEKKRLKALMQANADEAKKMKQEASDQVQKSVTDFEQRKSVFENSASTTKQQVGALTAEYTKLEREKKSQIETLEAEELALKDEHKRETEINAARVRQTEADWERKYEAMISEIQEKHEQLELQWSEKYNNTEEAEERNYGTSTAEWERELEAVKQHWEEKKQTAAQVGTQKCNEAEAVWKKKFDAKMAENNELRRALEKIAADEEKAADMAHRIASILPQLAPAGPGNPVEYNRVITLLNTFMSEFEQNQLSKTRQLQLLRGDFATTRCREIPMINEQELEKQKQIEEGAEEGKRPTRATSPHRVFRSVAMKAPRN